MVCANLTEAVESPSNYTMVIGAAENGFLLSNPHVAFICESDFLVSVLFNAVVEKKNEQPLTQIPSFVT